MNVEQVVAKVDDLKDGQMKEVSVGEQDILLVRVNGRYHAFHADCPHEGAPLAKGVLCDGHIRCPWHHALFDAETGELEEPPSLDLLRHYDCRVQGNEVVVAVPSITPQLRPPAMASPDASADGRTFVILGGGAAGLTAAETLRQEGFRGRIVLMTREPHPPYDRTVLSKTYIRRIDAKEPFIRGAEFFEEHGIELHTGREATEVSVQARTVTCADGERMTYDRLLLATGGDPRTLGVPGEGLDGVLAFRTYDDARDIADRVRQGARAVLIGASFIALELAAALVRREVSVTVVAPEATPFELVFGREIGEMYRKVHEQRGVAFRLGHTVDRFEGDRALAAVVTSDGERMEADFAVVGIGVKPATGYLTDLPAAADGSIAVGPSLRAAEDVWAAGDLAQVPDPRTGEPVRLEHWRPAQQQARVAARNMAGREETFNALPFFWTNQHGRITQYVGCARRWEDVVFDGDPAEQQFLAYYVSGGKVLAAAGLREQRKMCLIAEVLRDGATPTPEELRSAVGEMEEALA
jgi:NADPH-dependent 2,4-dienoyl-CoA reductase/sulfur reductase-like enzyme/nitrite reductase/ring-hydroxylating ferredoxin subunit